ncbi:MAG TPA: DUF5671 domain-containing protein [Candidatus Paceibacterota bacterium]
MDKIKTTPKDFFLQLGTMAALYVSAISLINLLFQTINYAFPDKLAYYGDPYSTGIRWTIASLIIIFPLFLFLSRLAGKDVQLNPEKLELPIRKWLIYLTLFVAGIAVVVDLIALVNIFLGGEITTRFILKVLTILVVAGGVFGYFIYDLRQKDTLARKDKMFAWIAIIAVLASIIIGFTIMGSPAAARERRFDDQRISDLQNIQWQIVNYWQQKEKFPKSLSDLEDPISGFRLPVDPNTDDAYEYILGEGMSFQLCANFNLSTIGESDKLKGRDGYGSSYPTPMPIYDGVGGGIADNWEHNIGRYCFERVIDPDKYPPINKERKI